MKQLFPEVSVIFHLHLFVSGCLSRSAASGSDNILPLRTVPRQHRPRRGSVTPRVCINARSFTRSCRVTCLSLCPSPRDQSVRNVYAAVGCSSSSTNQPTATTVANVLIFLMIIMSPLPMNSGLATSGGAAVAPLSRGTFYGENLFRSLGKCY